MEQCEEFLVFFRRKVNILCVLSTCLPVCSRSVDIHPKLSTIYEIWSWIRAMGHYIRFIKNRDLAAENIMTTAVRVRLVLSSPPGCLSSLIHRLRVDSIPLPKHSSITLAGELQTLRGNLPGEFALQLRSSRRNTKRFTISDTSHLPGRLTILLRDIRSPHTYRPDLDATHTAMIAGRCDYSYPYDIFAYLSTDNIKCRHEHQHVDMLLVL